MKKYLLGMIFLNFLMRVVLVFPDTIRNWILTFKERSVNTHVAVRVVTSAFFNKKSNGFGFTNNTRNSIRKRWNMKKMDIHGQVEERSLILLNRIECKK